MNNIKLFPRLLVFAEVGNRRSFTRAAEYLGMSKSAVSLSISKLEHEVGQQLLIRHTRGMALTAAGEKLLQRCELLRDQVQHAVDELTMSKEAPSGIFTVTFPHAFEEQIVVPALRQLCIEFPLVQPNIVVSDQVKNLVEENIDVAIYGGDPLSSDNRALPLGHSIDILCATPTFAQRHNLLACNDVSLLKSWIPAPWQANKLELHHRDDPSVNYTLDLPRAALANTLHCVLSMVLHDMGFAVLPQFIVQENIANGKLMQLLPEYRGRQWPFYFMHRYQGDKPIHIVRFYELVRHYFLKLSN